MNVSIVTARKSVNIRLKILLPLVYLPVYGLALICSIVLQGILKVINLDDYVDKRLLHTSEVVQQIIC